MTLQEKFILLLFSLPIIKKWFQKKHDDFIKQQTMIQGNEIWVWTFDIIKDGFYHKIINRDVVDQKPNIHDIGKDIHNNLYIWRHNEWEPFTNDMNIFMKLLPFAKEATTITLEKYFKS